MSRSRTHGVLVTALAAALLAPATASAQARLPRVTVIGTGGTIAGRSQTRTSFRNYRAGELSIDEMVDYLRPQVDRIADVATVQFGNRTSGSYDLGDYYDLTLVIQEALRDADAVVVTTGTDTMEEFVYWSDLTVQSRKPVVFTGALRPWTVIGSDAQANLFNAVVLAASGETACFGSVVMLNNEFHAAKDVWKSDSSRLDSFVDRRVGILGYIDGLDVHTLRAPPRIQFCDDPERWRTPFDLAYIEKDDLPRVEILIGYQGARLDEAVGALADAGVQGIVLAGGGVSLDAQAAARGKGVTFVRTERFRSGRGEPMPPKARLLLALSLAYADTPEAALALYEEIGTLEFGERTADPL